MTTPARPAPTGQPRPANDGTPSISGPGAMEPWRAFCEWAARQLGAELIETQEGYRVREPDAACTPATTDSGLWSMALLNRRKIDSADQVEPLDLAAATERELVEALLAEIAGLDEKPILAPADQPTATHEITERLFGAYQIDGGKVHLGGCRLAPTRFVRWSTAGIEEGELVVRHTFADESGGPLPPDLAEAVGLTGKLIATDPRSAGVASTASAGAPATADDRPPRFATAVVVVLRAAGALEATIGGAEVSIPFDDWARRLQPPPAVCPESGVETFHLVAIEDGRVAAAEATGVCDQSGRRLLLDDLRTCGVTGRQLDAELCVDCPVTGDPVAKDALATCPKCNQQVSRSIVDGSSCDGCRNPSKMPRDHPLRAELLRSAPKLSRWRGWKLAETASVRIVEASTLWRSIVVVFDQDGGQPIYAATRPRLGGGWSATPLSALQA